jgi:hypothetical protein
MDLKAEQDWLETVNRHRAEFSPNDDVSEFRLASASIPRGPRVPLSNSFDGLL